MTIKIDELAEVKLLPGFTVLMAGMEIEAEIEDGKVIEITCQTTAPHSPIELYGFDPDPFKRLLYLALRDAIQREYPNRIADETAANAQRGRDAARDLARRSALESAA